MRFWEKKIGKNITSNDFEGSNVNFEQFIDANEIREKESNNSSHDILCNTSNSIRNESENPISKVNIQQERITSIFNEYEAVTKNPIEGVYVTPGADSPLVWFGLLIVRTGIFYGGIFRFTITIPDDFPNTISIPEVQFEESLFHPLINPRDNYVDLNRFFPSGWQKGRNHLYQVIIATQGIFFSCHCDSAQAANPEAAILIKENRHKFIQLAHDAVRRSRTQVYAMPNSDDPNAIRFTPWNETEMEPYRLFLLGKRPFPESPENKDGSNMHGISWINNKESWTYFTDD